MIKITPVQANTEKKTENEEILLSCAEERESKRVTVPSASNVESLPCSNRLVLEEGLSYTLMVASVKL